VREKLTRLRDETTPPKIFRELVAEIATLLLYEATADLPTDDREVRTPLAPYKGARLRDKVGLIPVLRAGIGMVEAALELMPEAQVWHIGLFRGERTLRPIEYYNKLPSSATVQVCLVLDPMLATGGSASHAIGLCREAGARDITLAALIAAP
jgi:uracil phosphoribosyltransferase